MKARDQSASGARADEWAPALGSGLLQKRIRKLHLSSQKGFHGLACSAFNCLWDSWVKDTFNRYINRLPRRKRCYQMLSPGERTRFTVSSKNNRSEAILTSPGVGREEESPGKSRDPERGGKGESKKEGGATINTPTLLWPTADASALLPGRSTALGIFEILHVQSSRVLERQPGARPCRARALAGAQQDAGEWKADAA